MRRSTKHSVRPLHRGKTTHVAVAHDDFAAIEYEIFIPAGIWTHTAVQEFLDEPLKIEGGATVSKGATGFWRGSQEETHVIRIVIRADSTDPAEFFDSLQERVGRLMARLAEWPEARQQEVMFTAKEVRLGVSRLAVRSR